MTIVATINLHKRLHGVTFKRKASRAVSEIKKFASKIMSTKDVRVDTDLNKAVWSKGVRNVPYRMRIKLSRKRNPDAESSGMYTVAEFVADEPSRKQTTRKEASKADD